MRISPVSISPASVDHVLRDVAASIAPVTTPAHASTSSAVDAPTSGAPSMAATRLARLIGARVPGGIDFSGIRPEPKGPTIPLYRHPADANAAATRLAVPSMVDLTA